METAIIILFIFVIGFFSGFIPDLVTEISESVKKRKANRAEGNSK